ncbi:hypothetical protein ABZP36_008517 [Zizania latifolia]
MAVQAQYGGLAGCFPRGFEADEVELQMRVLQEYGALLSAAGGGNGGGYDCAAVVSGAEVSELTCNNVGGGGVMASRKRGREVVDVEQYVSSSAALLPIPGMAKAETVAVAPAPQQQQQQASGSACTASSPSTCGSRSLQLFGVAAAASPSLTLWLGDWVCRCLQWPLLAASFASSATVCLFVRPSGRPSLPSERVKERRGEKERKKRQRRVAEQSGFHSGQRVQL